MNIFNTARIRITELYEDSISFMKQSYDDVGQYFSMASPMGQLLQVILSYGRMILYYIEDSVTELNIKTASRPQSIRGLVGLTGHNPSRSISARGTLRFNYNGQQLPSNTSIVTIPNYSTLVNNLNGLTYTILLPTEEIRLDVTNVNNFVEVSVVQGSIEYQQATGAQSPLQSFNFQTKKGASIDNYYVNIYVDGKKWDIIESILDMGFEEESCMVKTGQTGGIDVFFGNGYNGKIPRLGSVIMVEYLLTDGLNGNLNTNDVNLTDTWKFSTSGYNLGGEQVDLNKILTVSIKNQILFGTGEEPLYLTRMLAPHMSRSFVLANAKNYIYFLKKLNIFSIIDAIPGYATFEDRYALDKYNTAQNNYEQVRIAYLKSVSTYGVDSTQAQALKTTFDYSQQQVYFYQNMINEQKKDDNTVYLFLVPDVSKRLAESDNYYTTSIDTFKLNTNEKTAIYDLIEESGQRILTVDNAILDIKYPRFNLNMSVYLWEGYEYDNVRQTIISKTSEYFLANTRRDRIPVSDLIRIVEGIDGIDSVNIWFDADKNNFDIYRSYYGIDEFGDVILERTILDAFGNQVGVKDIYPIFRGGFENFQGTYYEDSLTKNKLSSLNIQVRGYSKQTLNSEANIAIVNNI